MNNLLIAIAVFVITVVCALFAVPYFIDWNSYRSAFEEEARNVIGRDVEVDGDVNLYLLPTPYFRVEKVRIADTSTMLSEHFFKTDSLSIKLSIAPLLRGVVEVNEIEFQRPVLRVALDAGGAWNWQSFAKALSSTGYMPANVSLSSLRIVDGTLAFHGTDGSERGRVDGINGELSTPALEGPYRFRGTYAVAGARREVRIGTAAPEADGKVPFRATFRRLDTGASYALDARAVDIMGKPRIEGEVTARLPIAAPPPPDGASRRASAGSDEELRIDESETPLEVKAQMKADVAGAVFSDATLTFEQGDRPQVVSGNGRAIWGTPVAVEMDLSSRWLDLDRLAGADEGIGPLGSATKLAGWLRELLPGEGRVRMGVSVEQANLAGEAIGPLRLALARTGDKLEITELRTALPGGSRGDFKGDISGTADALAFNGNLGLRGSSTARFLAWATGNEVKLTPEADGAFDMRAQLAMDSSQATVRDLTGTLAGTLLKGGARYKWSGRPELAISLEGPKLDVRGFLRPDFSLLDLASVLTSAASARREDPQAPAASNAVLRALQADLDLQLRAGQLVTAARSYRDLSSTVTMKGGSLKQLALNLSGDDGFSLQLDGRIDNLAASPKGTLRGLIVAEAADSIGPLAALLGIPRDLRPGDSRAQALLPLRLAGTLTFGGRTATATDVLVDGEMSGAPVKISARLDGSAGGWRTSRADITASVEAGDAARLSGLLLPGSAGAPQRIDKDGRPASAKPGRILIRAAGVPADGLTSLVSVDTPDLALNFRGQSQLDDAGAKADGELEARGANATALAALIGLPPALRADGVPVAARLKLAVDDGSITMDRLAMQLGASRLSGKIVLSPAGERRRIDASLSTDDISVGTLLGTLLDRRFAAAGVAEAALFGQSPWPDEPFSAALLDAFEGRIELSSRRLTLADGLGVDGAKIVASLQPGKVDVKEISGTALGGPLKGSASIAKAPAGADVRATLSLGLALEAIPGARTLRTGGPVSATLAFNGRGLSPRAIVAALQGEGSIAFGEGAKLPVLSPGAVASSAATALKAESSQVGPALRQVLSAQLPTSSLAVGQATYPLEIVDGQVRTKSLAVSDGNGLASGTARLDLKSLKLDAQWRVEAKIAGPDAARPLPAVIVTYRAPLAGLSGAEQQLDSAAIEQELSARKIERDIEELERLRRSNEINQQRRPAEPALQPALPAQGVPIIPATPMPPPASIEPRAAGTPG